MTTCHELLPRFPKDNLNKKSVRDYHLCIKESPEMTFGTTNVSNFLLC